MSMWSRALAFLRDEGNRALLGWIGGGLAAVAAGLWAVYIYFFPPQIGDGGGAIKVEANCGSAAAQGTFLGSSITVGGESSKADCPPKAAKDSAP
jgi:hypothetical protein